MTIQHLIELIKFILILGSVYIILLFIIKPMVDKYLDIKNKEIKNKLAEIYNTIDTKAVRTEVDQYIQKYIDQYILYKFIANKVSYIKQQEVDDMIKDVTKSVCKEIPELYIYYIKLIYSVSTDEELVTFVHQKTMALVIESVSNYNSSQE